LREADEKGTSDRRKSTMYLVIEGGPTRELAPARPRPEGPSTIPTDIRSLTLDRFLGGGSDGAGRQDPILAEITWWGPMLIWPKIFTSLTKEKTPRFWLLQGFLNSYVEKKRF
jgi:hypothetical protein